jgi:hypothetical protein
VATKRKKQTKKKTATRSKTRVADPPLSLHPMKFTDVLASLLDPKNRPAR